MESAPSIRCKFKELTYVLELLDSILDNPQKKYYVVIDGLDENSVEQVLRYLLIRAIIETARDFRRVRHAKIIVALRFDLLDRVLRGVQDFWLYVSWLCG